MSRPTHVLAAAAMTSLVLAVAGCGGSSDKTAAAPAAKATTSAAPSESTTPSESATAGEDNSGATAEFTKQGTKLKLGEKAIVPFMASKVKGALGVTAVSIEKGKTADLAPLKLGDQVKGFTPYYVTFKVTNESGNDYAFTSLGITNGLLADGSRAQDVIVIGDFKPCDSASAPESFTKKGASYLTCTLALAGSGTTVTGAQYTAYDSENKVANTDYSTDAIAWK